MSHGIGTLAGPLDTQLSSVPDGGPTEQHGGNTQSHAVPDRISLEGDRRTQSGAVGHSNI